MFALGVVLCNMLCGQPPPCDVKGPLSREDVRVQFLDFLNSGTSLGLEEMKKYSEGFQRVT